MCVSESVSLPTSFLNRLPDLSETHVPLALALSLSLCLSLALNSIAFLLELLLVSNVLLFQAATPEPDALSSSNKTNDSKIYQLKQELLTSNESSLSHIMDMGVSQCKRLYQ